MSSPTSDVSIDDGNITVTSGLYDTDDGIKLQVSGDTEPRIHLTPQGEVKTGDGSATPTSLAGGPVFVYDSDGTQAGNVYTDWSTILTAATAVEGPKTIAFAGNETLPTTGMPSGGWVIPANTTLQGSAFGLAASQTVLTIPDGCELTFTDGAMQVDNLIIYSPSSSSVVTQDAAGVLLVQLTNAAKIVCDTEAFFDINNASAYFISNFGVSSGFYTDTSLTALGAGSIADGDHPVAKLQAAALALVSGSSGSAELSTGTLEGAANVTISFATPTSGNFSATHAGVSGSITTDLSTVTSTMSHSQSDAANWTVATGSSVAAHLDELASRVNALENP